MRNVGFVLIEAIISLALACLIILICCNIYAQNEKNLEIVGNKIDSMDNLRIAMDFVGDELRAGQIIVIDSGGVNVNGVEIYLKNNILRINADSEQIASNISSFKVYKENEFGLYRITLISGEYTMNSLIKAR